MIHIAAGFSALTSFWIPMLVKKGGRAHVRIGWFYVAAMSVVAITAVAMALMRLFAQSGSSPEQKTFAAFMIFISVLSASSAWFGIRVLHHKKRTGVHTHLGDLAWSVTLLLASLVTMIAGFSLHAPLLMYFPLVGLVVSWGQLRYWRRPRSELRHWWLRHMSGMFASCIATVTAFTVFGGPRFLAVPREALWLWLAPTAILLPILLVWSRVYRRIFARG